MSRPPEHLGSSESPPIRRKSSVGEVLQAINSQAVEVPKPSESSKPPPKVDAGAALQKLAQQLKGLSADAELLPDEADAVGDLKRRREALAGELTPQLESTPRDFDPWLLKLRQLEKDVADAQLKIDGLARKKAAGYEKPFKEQRARQAQDIERFDKADFGSPPPADLKAAWEMYSAERPRLKLAEEAGDYLRAMSALTKVIEGIKAINNALPQLEGKLKNAEKIAKSVDDYQGDEAFNKPAEKVKAALARANKAYEGNNFATAYEALDAMEAARGELREASANALLNTKGASRAEVLKKAMAFVDKDPGMLKTLVAKRPAGEKLLDELVESLGGKATGKAGEGQKAFVKQAIIARYGLEEEGLTGILSTKALPRLYKVMGMVPNTHTQTNDALKKVERRREGDESFYKASTKEVVVTCKRTGWNADTSTFDPDAGKKTKVPAFDAHTLHEIGHAVDAKETFMDGPKGKEKQHGGWEQGLTPEGIADKLYGDTKFKFAAKWEKAGCSPAFLKAYLAAALKGNAAKAAGAGKISKEDLLADAAVKSAAEAAAALAQKPKPTTPDAIKKLEAAKLKFAKAAVGKSKSKDADVKNLLLQVATLILDGKKAAEAVKEALAEVKIASAPDQLDWAALAKDEAVKWCEAVRLKGSSTGLWEGGASSATANALSDSRVYQEAYRGTWVSYDLTARGAGISSYQFRAPGEWFAEAYAAFFLQKLKTGHPLYTWLQTQLPADHPLKAKAA
ncbi:hypothetical protein J2X20_005715 [Pelomonas saccharophila]|uniref:Uncharacterized protein n=1 Tax=Roseateles saccharophilus TaxID=304 RepID=A0ABU1YVZ2_ROSSA|nr:hypothetical protein [Roseateles saccharophilus]MDR7273030.1 hypothetical protein [Roseateles saccharophilus]